MADLITKINNDGTYRKLAFPATNHPFVSVIGYALGGGSDSILAPLTGKLCYFIQAVKIILKGKSPQWIDDSNEPDLMKLIRGGGQNLGVIVSMRFHFPSTMNTDINIGVYQINSPSSSRFK